MVRTNVVAINEEECIGCTKCIEHCPVDAIVGARKLMHTVITEQCIGCELCLPPCPMDCIEIIRLAEPTPEQKKEKAILAKLRVKQRKQRLNAQEKILEVVNNTSNQKKYIEAALLRVQAKKSNKIL